MEPDADAEPQAKIQELEKQVAALKKDNTKLKNEMRFNLEQEKFVESTFCGRGCQCVVCFVHLYIK